jgi:excisionase family DNA binding protein
MSTPLANEMAQEPEDQMHRHAARPSPTSLIENALPDAMHERVSPTRLLTAEEVAERLGVGVKWVWAQARSGAIPHVRLGRYKRFRPEAIDAWIAQLEEGGAD